MQFLSCTTLVLLVFSCAVCASRVLELSDRFLDVRSEGQWFVMFYAPWCAYCKRTEPIWAHVAQALYNTNVRVGRIDGTRFPSVAQELQISGFPTIIFFKGNQHFVYNGDRTKEELITYVHRMSLDQPVQLVTKTESFEMLKSTNPLFFIYIGPHEGSIWEIYNKAAAYYQSHAYFYSTHPEISNQHFEIKTLPAMIVYKEENYYHYPYSDSINELDVSVINETIHDWINIERFMDFPKITRFNINQMLKTRKWLVIAVVEENKLSEIAMHELEFRDMIESVIRTNREKYHEKFQFGWIGEPDIAHSIVLDTLPTPHLIVINSTTEEHHIPEDEPLKMTLYAVHMFLDSISNQTAPSYGGNSYIIRVFRTYFEAKKSLKEMWRGNPILTSVLFGLPLGFLSLILYSIFCGDCLDAPEEDDEDTHEKKE